MLHIHNYTRPHNFLLLSLTQRFLIETNLNHSSLSSRRSFPPPSPSHSLLCTYSKGDLFTISKSHFPQDFITPARLIVQLVLRKHISTLLHHKPSWTGTRVPTTSSPSLIIENSEKPLLHCLPSWPRGYLNK